MDDERDDWPEADDASPSDAEDGAACAWLPTAAPVRQGPGYRVFTLIPRTSFGWDSVTEGSELSYDVGFPIDVVGTPDVLVVLRVHAISGTTSVARLVLEAVSRSDEEPAVTYVDSVPLATLRTGPSVTAGTCLVARARCDTTPMIRSMIYLDRLGKTDVSSITLSAELIARASDPGGCTCRTAR